MFNVFHFERVTKNSTFSHFLLMLGYKLFSFYLPLFLLEKGLSLPKVGFVYLLIYLPIAIFSPIAGLISHKISPFILIIIGIFGYGTYSLGMLLLPLSLFFYVLQVALGISASLFFVGNRVVMLSAHLDKPAKSFGWFYSAPRYASGFAPAIGAFVIFLWGFNGVFIASILIYLINILFTAFSIPKNSGIQTTAYRYKDSLEHFRQLIEKSLSLSVLPVITFSLAILILAGFYQFFFLIFLKSIGWDRNQILIYSSLFSLIFLPIPLLSMGILSSSKIIKNIFIGGVIFAISSISIGLWGPLAGFTGILILMEIGEFGSFLSNASRSGFFSKIFSSFPHGSASLDTILSPLGAAIGALAGGVLIGYIGYQGLFILGGVSIISLAFLLGNHLTRKEI